MWSMKSRNLMILRLTLCLDVHQKLGDEDELLHSRLIESLRRSLALLIWDLKHGLCGLQLILEFEVSTLKRLNVSAHYL